MSNETNTTNHDQAAPAPVVYALFFEDKEEPCAPEDRSCSLWATLEQANAACDALADELSLAGFPEDGPDDEYQTGTHEATAGAQAGCRWHDGSLQVAWVAALPLNGATAVLTPGRLARALGAADEHGPGYDEASGAYDDQAAAVERAL